MENEHLELYQKEEKLRLINFIPRFNFLLFVGLFFYTATYGQVSQKKVFNDFLSNADLTELSKYFIDSLSINNDIITDTLEVKKRYASNFFGDTYSGNSGSRPYLLLNASEKSYRKTRLKLNYIIKKTIRSRNLPIEVDFNNKSYPKINMTIPLSNGNNHYVYFKVKSGSGQGTEVDLFWVLIYDKSFQLQRCVSSFAIH